MYKNNLVGKTFFDLDMYEMDFVLSKQTSASSYNTLVYGDIDQLAEYIQKHSLAVSTSLV